MYSYKEELGWFLIKGLVGFVIGIVFLKCSSESASIMEAALLGVFFMGLPYGWQLSSAVVGSWYFVGNMGYFFMGIIFRVMISLLVGWIAFPIRLIYLVYKTFKEKTSVGE